MDLKIFPEEDVTISGKVYTVYDGDEWLGSFVSEEDAEDFIEMLKSRDEDRQSFNPHP